jgi:hypothetical protein
MNPQADKIYVRYVPVFESALLPSLVIDPVVLFA